MIEALRSELVALRQAAAPLEPDADARARLMDLAVAHAQDFLGDLADGPANRGWDDALADPLDFAEDGRDPAELLAYIGRAIDRPGITTASPRFMGYIPGGGLFHSAVGDFLAASANKYAGFASAAPGAVRLENATAAWLAKVIGFPEGAAGTLTSGGSMANLTAIVTAREARDEDGGGAVYMSATAHHCIDKALKIAGRGKAPRRLIPTDARHQMRADALAEALERDRADGIRPWLVIASAGTVDTGAVDPLADIADLAQRHGAWFHVDGAYGGLFMLCDEGRAALGGIERADTVALDPHKTLFLPYGTGAVVARDGQMLFDAFSASADYIQPLGESGVGPSPGDLSPELTRHFRALRLWLPLQIAGVAAFRAAQSEKIKLARYFHARLSEMPGWEVASAPDLSVVAFRARPASGDVDRFNDDLLRRIQQDGRIFLSGTRIGGAPWLRCAILSFRTHLDAIDETIDVLARTAGELGLE
ncbi:pyridoxal phosphate-dependent decarboxylase family protein [Allosphingosinicella indica]|uniref:Glutamate or tyrosine decarboxylase n=1 Tax=Allosphingosinicella indica TaxID=941907 RepID=A0A1X7GKD8_9SPHN|nr:aminotransferase class V-fold PLP-dependent enzyme [Allosphingosinicella indica]SMF71145.1 Glutamate or tyrosine decarboxylase [Allosphingosinicella indica]